MNKPEARVVSSAFARYASSPPDDSALARAIAYGIDPTITFHAMFVLTPKERLDRAGRIIRQAREIAQLRAERTRL